MPIHPSILTVLDLQIHQVEVNTDHVDVNYKLKIHAHSQTQCTNTS